MDDLGEHGNVHSRPQIQLHVDVNYKDVTVFSKVITGEDLCSLCEIGQVILIQKNMPCILGKAKWESTFEDRVDYKSSRNEDGLSVGVQRL